MSSRSPPTQLAPEEFRGETLRRKGRWVVAFSADWCPFCRAFRELFDAAAADPGSSLAIADLTSEENPLWERFRIEVVPTLVVFREGRTVFRADGVRGEGLRASDLDRALRAARAGAEPPDRDGPS